MTEKILIYKDEKITEHNKTEFILRYLNNFTNRALI